MIIILEFINCTPKISSIERSILKPSNFVRMCVFPPVKSFDQSKCIAFVFTPGSHGGFTFEPCCVDAVLFENTVWCLLCVCPIDLVFVFMVLKIGPY